jgi:hypothetical protein
MKKLILILFLATFYSCNKSQTTSSQEEKKIEIRSMKIGDFEVMLNKTDQMSWSDAQQYGKSLGNGWRLPTKEEFELLKTNQPTLEKSLSSLNVGGYWVSTEFNESLAWQSTFEFGYLEEFYSKNTLANVIFIKSLNK